MKVVILVALFIYAFFGPTSANYTAGIDARIYGGQSARIGQFPYIANLVISTRGGTYACGGSLISDQWVLTAAHCTQGATSISVKLGITDSNSNSGQTRVATTHYEHARYNGIDVVNDIALIKLPSKVTLNNNVNVIQLPKRSQASVNTFQGKSAVIAGWGRTSNGQSRSVRYMQYANVQMMNHRNCQNYYRSYSVGNGEICSNNAQSRSGTCQGDSGGPLVYNENGKNILIGITSWGVSQCQSSAPSVYTNVAAYLGFINYRTGIPIQ